MIYFLSDVHLGYGLSTDSLQREFLLIDALDALVPHATQLIIVGDLFDYWFEYRTVIPRKFFRTLAALDRLTRRGIAIEYVVGNHDFGHCDFFKRELGIDVHWHDIQRTFFAKRFYIAHGDGKVAGDWGYLLLRGVLRSKIANTLYRWIHPDIGIGLASRASIKSRAHTNNRTYGEVDSLAQFAQQKICCEGFDYVVMGHRHKPSIIEYSCNGHHGTYVNLGDWLSAPLIGCFDGSDFRLIEASALVRGFTER